MNLDATLMPHSSASSSFMCRFKSWFFTGAFSGAVNLRPKEGKEEKLEQRQITPARRRMPWMPWMPWRLFGGLHSVRFDPPPREPKGPKVSLPEKLPEVSIELPIEKEGKEEDFRKFPTVLNTLKINKSKNGVNVWQNFTFFTI